MFPGIAYYMSRWYRRSELTFRLSIYVAMAPFAGAIGGLLASGILKLSHLGSLHQWRMIFAVEGIITIGLALIAFVTLTDRPETATWLNQEEKDLAIARVKSERVGTTEVLDRIDRTKTIRGILNPVTIATAIMSLLISITVQGLAFFAPTIVRTIYPTSSVISQQLHTVPQYFIGAIVVLAASYFSTYLDKRLHFMIGTLPIMIPGYIMFLASKTPRVRYAATFLIAAGAFPLGSLNNAHISANVLSDTARSSGIGFNVMFSNIGGLISTWSYLPFDAPNYPIGNGLNLATGSTCMLLGIGLYFWMIRDNRRKEEKTRVDEELEGLSEKEIQDLDWRHPAFRWRL